MDERDYAAMNATYQSYFQAGRLPARTCIGVTGLAVNALVDAGETRPGDVAVFYRTNAQSRVFEEVFIRLGMPYRVVGGVKFYDRREVKDALAYLNVLVNPSDAVSLLRIANRPRRAIGEGQRPLVRLARQAGAVGGELQQRQARGLGRQAQAGQQFAKAIQRHGLADDRQFRGERGRDGGTPVARPQPDSHDGAVRRPWR
mgnify:CR=1 FL=1